MKEWKSYKDDIGIISDILNIARDDGYSAVIHDDRISRGSSAVITVKMVNGDTDYSKFHDTCIDMADRLDNIADICEIEYYRQKQTSNHSDIYDNHNGALISVKYNRPYYPAKRFWKKRK